MTQFFCCLHFWASTLTGYGSNLGYAKPSRHSKTCFGGRWTRFRFLHHVKKPFISLSRNLKLSHKCIQHDKTLSFRSVFFNMSNPFLSHYPMIIPNFHPSTIPMIVPVFSPHVAWTPLFLSKPRRTSKADSNSTFLVVDVSSETVEEGVEGVGIGFWMVARRLSGPCWKI